MKQFYVLLTLSLVFPRLSQAQDLAENNRIANAPSTREISTTGSASTASSGTTTSNPLWEREQDQINGHINSGKLSNMKMVTETIVTFLHDSCISDERYTPTWHGEYFSEKTSSAAFLKFGVFCNFYEQKAKLTILANDLTPLLDHLFVNNQHFFTVPSTNTAKNGATCFTPTPRDSEEANSLPSKIWLITADNHQLLYTPVSRREYLREARIELNNIKNSILLDLKSKMPLRSVAVQEAEKKTALEELNTQYSGIDLQMRIKMFLNKYKTDEEYLKANTDKETAGLDSTLHLMDHLAGHMSAAELDRPAIVSGQAADFQGFEDGRGGKMLIRINATYFNTYLSAEKPQFFLVCWQYDTSATMANDIDRQLQEKLDCEKLKEMLGK